MSIKDMWVLAVWIWFLLAILVAYGFHHADKIKATENTRYACAEGRKVPINNLTLDQFECRSHPFVKSRRGA